MKVHDDGRKEVVIMVIKMDRRVEELAAPPEKEQVNIIPHDTQLVNGYKTESWREQFCVEDEGQNEV